MLINYLNASITMDGKSSNYPELQKFPLPWVAEVSITMDGRELARIDRLIIGLHSFETSTPNTCVPTPSSLRTALS
jgi:hypothetical protein